MEKRICCVEIILKQLHASKKLVHCSKLLYFFLPFLLPVFFVALILAKYFALIVCLDFFIYRKSIYVAGFKLLGVLDCYLLR